MSLMLGLCLAILIAATAADDFSVVEQDGVRVEASIRSQLYIWDITNVDAQPITRFEIEQQGVYNHEVPTGWEYSHEHGHFKAWVTHERHAIQPGRTARFTARSGSAGSSLGLRPLTLGLGEERELIVPQVWAPVEKPISMVILVAVTLVLIAAVHMLLTRRRGTDKLHSARI